MEDQGTWPGPFHHPHLNISQEVHLLYVHMKNYRNANFTATGANKYADTISTIG